jgi:hypothetical protein
MTEDHVMGFPALFSPVLTRDDVTRRGLPGCAHAQPEVGVPALFSGVFLFLFIFQFVFNFCISFFCHSIFTSNKTNFFTMSVASKGDGSKSPVTSVMLCPAHN